MLRVFQVTIAPIFRIELRIRVHCASAKANREVGGMAVEKNCQQHPLCAIKRFRAISSQQ